LTLFVDTSVWSLAFRRHEPASSGVVAVLARSLENGDAIVTTGIVLQELLQGFAGPKTHEDILRRFSSVAMMSPDRDDHIGAADLRNHCRRNGVQVGTIDALLARLCIRHDLTMLSADKDFVHIAGHSPLRLWS
jgi:predicted nucleic acid-binding protein